MQNASADDKPAILIVDDEPINLKLLRAHLQKRGYAVIEADNGKLALEKALLRPELILLDIMMPHMDGIETCRLLKQNEATKDIPVIFLSALSEAGIKTKGFEVGGVDYISKPFDSRELLARVKTHITLRDQERRIREYAGNLEEMVQERTRRLTEAESEIRRDYGIQTVVASLLRSSMEDISPAELMQRALDVILTVPWLSFEDRGLALLAEQSEHAFTVAAERNALFVPDAGQISFPAGSFESLDSRSEIMSRIGRDHPLHGFLSRRLGKTELFSLPIRNAGELLGAIIVSRKQDKTPDQKELRFLVTVSGTLAGAALYKKAQERLVDSEERYRTIFENTGTAMAIVGEDMRVLLVNSGFALLSGHSREEIEGRLNIAAFFPEAEMQRLTAWSARLRQEPAAPPGVLEFQFRNRAGEERATTLTMSMLPGAGQRVVSLSDVTDRKRAEDRLLHHILHDTLTGLPNRASLLDRLASELEIAGTDPRHMFALLLMDLDRFNIVNESLGHSMGDKLLMALAARLEFIVGENGFVARLGGDEFAVLITAIDAPGRATELAANLLAVVRQPFPLPDQELVTTASIGISLSDFGYERAEDLLRDADSALYRAKQMGKARYEVFDQEMHFKARELLVLVNDLRQAVKRKEFEIHYQAIVSLETRRAAGFEALVRWRRPGRGLVGPMDFIPAAEEAGLIIPIGQWVLAEACKTMSRLYAEHNISPCLMLSVNLSGKQFAQEDLYEQIRDALDESGLSPNCLKLEITESVAMENAPLAIATLAKLKSLRVRLSIDDFGTGYSSLSYLHRFPVDMLKIDRSFVSRMNQGDENLEIVRTIVRLASSLNLEIIAEGVETKEQLDLLQALGCQYGQGYYFSKPVDEATLVERALLTMVW